MTNTNFIHDPQEISTIDVYLYLFTQLTDSQESHLQQWYVHLWMPNHTKLARVAFTSPFNLDDVFHSSWV